MIRTNNKIRPTICVTSGDKGTPRSLAPSFTIRKMMQRNNTTTRSPITKLIILHLLSLASRGMRPPVQQAQQATDRRARPRSPSVVHARLMAQPTATRKRSPPMHDVLSFIAVIALVALPSLPLILLGIFIFLWLAND